MRGVWRVFLGRWGCGVCRILHADFREYPFSDVGLIALRARYDWWLGVAGHPTGVPMSVRIASCSCGQLWAEVRGEPIGVSVCHCYACQRRTGSVFSAQASFPREYVLIKGDGTEFVRVGEQGGRFRFTFCPECGSTVFYVEEGDEQHIAIPVGAFADSHFPVPTISVYEERRHSWVSLSDDVVEHWRNP